jgi:hypothetical protein
MDGDVNERLLLNTFPRPAKAKLIKIRMISFFIVPTSYQDTDAGQAGPISFSFFRSHSGSFHAGAAQYAARL